ncbi:GAF domain-containing protein [Ktedonobacter sp. SOSP1-85]|uniref:GAF domain-containing protein n=1 Tax=Ktedonobacter sp. SOSP1-85 TaxID=2778367 RepID=UPI0019154BA6|nr:GAF domain-containing protein [Ktedonobacter sp. SOSP1-85]
MYRTWQELLGEIIKDPQERQRIAQEVGINPITLLRWVNKDSKPRHENIRLLLGAIPRHSHKAFAQLIIADFPSFSQENAMTTSRPPDPPSAFYTRVLSAYANTPKALFSFVMYELILQQIIEHLDPDRLGMAVTIMRCVRPLQGTRVRSLRQINGKGTPPWNSNLEQETIFLGAESLAGTAVMYGRLTAVQSREDPYTFTHWTEHEQSAVAHPLTHKEKIAGCLLISSTQPQYFTRNHLAAVEHYANLMSLLFEPEDFFDFNNIKLDIMPHYTIQRPYFRHVGERITQKIAAATAAKSFITFQEAQESVWQEIEEQLLMLPSTWET